MHPRPHDPARAVHPLSAAEHRRGHGARAQMQVRRRGREKQRARELNKKRVLYRWPPTSKAAIEGARPLKTSAWPTKRVFCTIRSVRLRAHCACVFRGRCRLVRWGLLVPASAPAPLVSLCFSRASPISAAPAFVCLPLPWASAGNRFILYVIPSPTSCEVPGEVVGGGLSRPPPVSEPLCVPLPESAAFLQSVSFVEIPRLSCPDAGERWEPRSDKAGHQWGSPPLGLSLTTSVY